MEFNNIHLPPIVLAGLYKHSLVLVEGESVGNGKWLEDNSATAIAEIPQAKVVDEAPIMVEAKVIVEVKKAEIEPSEPKKVENPTKNIDVEQKTTQDEAAKSLAGTSVNIQAVNAEPAKIKFLGGFQKKISIVVAEHFQLHINDENLAFLSKLLQACQLSLNDVAIINVASNQANTAKLWQLMPAAKMIMFDVDPGTLGLPFRLSHFKLQPWDDCVFLSAPSLEALQEGTQEQVVQLKRNLWESLKKMFLS